jgi:hypothetical protein
LRSPILLGSAGGPRGSELLSDLVAGPHGLARMAAMQTTSNSTEAAATILSDAKRTSVVAAGVAARG